jgi:hypothetical protein
VFPALKEEVLMLKDERARSSEETNTLIELTWVKGDLTNGTIASIFWSGVKGVNLELREEETNCKDRDKF